MGGPCGSRCATAVILVISLLAELYVEVISHPEVIPFSSRAIGVVADKLFFFLGLHANTPFPAQTWLVRARVARYGERQLLGARAYDVTINEHMYARVVRPDSLPEGERVSGMLWFHGGGWVIGDAAGEKNDEMFAEIIQQLGNKTIIVSVDYRMAPEHRWPVPADDCIAALDWLATTEEPLLKAIDRKRLILAGESAGANLAAVVTHDWLTRRHPKDVKIIQQLLIYPPVMNIDPETFDCVTPSCLDNAHLLILPKNIRNFFTRSYLPLDNEEARKAVRHPKFCLIQPDLKGTPPTHLIVGNFDPLISEELQYAFSLRKAGTIVEVTGFDDVHAFMNLNRARRPAAYAAMVQFHANVTAGTLVDPFKDRPY